MTDWGAILTRLLVVAWGVALIWINACFTRGSYEGVGGYFFLIYLFTIVPVSLGSVAGSIRMAWRDLRSADKSSKIPRNLVDTFRFRTWLTAPLLIGTCIAILYCIAKACIQYKTSR